MARSPSSPISMAPVVRGIHDSFQIGPRQEREQRANRKEQSLDALGLSDHPPSTRSLSLRRPRRPIALILRYVAHCPPRLPPVVLGTHIRPHAWTIRVQPTADPQYVRFWLVLASPGPPYPTRRPHRMCRSCRSRLVLSALAQRGLPPGKPRDSAQAH